MDANSESTVISGSELMALRNRLKLSRRQLTEQLGHPWTEGRLNGYEHEKRNLKPREFEVLANWLRQQQLPQGVAIATGQQTPQSVAVAATNDDAIELFHEPDPYDLTPAVETPGLTASQEPPVNAPGPGSGPVAQLPTTMIFVGDVQDHYVRVLNRIQNEAGGRYDIAWPLQRTFENWDELSTVELQQVEEWCANIEAWLDLLHEPGQALAESPAQEATTVQPAVAPAEEVKGAVGVAALHRDGLRLLTNSELQTFKHCRRRWWLAWYRGLRLKAETMTGVAELGTRVHKALAGWYVPEGEAPVDPRETLEKTIQDDELKLLQVTAEQDSAMVAETLGAFTTEADMARAMIEGYVEWLAETGADAGMHVIAPEQVVTAVLEMSEQLTIQLQGRLDVRVQRDHDLVKLFLDHKTVGDFKTPARILPIDEQMKHYHVLEEAQDETDGTRTEGAIYNMLRRVKRTATAKPPFYERIELRHNPRTIDNFRERLRGEALVIDHTETLLGEGVNHQLIAYPSPGRDCTWKCEFTALCPMLDDGSRAEDFIAEYYDSVDPLDRYPEEKG